MAQVFNIGNDPILTNPYTPMDMTQELDRRIQYLQNQKEQFATIQQNNNASQKSLWIEIDNEIRSLNEEQRTLLFQDKTYMGIDTELQFLVQQAIIESVKGVVEKSPRGKELLQNQLNYIKSSKDAIIRESNRKYEIFEKFKIAAQANPNLTYKEFCETLNK